MSSILRNKARLRLARNLYGDLRQQMLRRDAWRCQHGAMRNLEVHHQTFRIHAGEDSDQKLVTFCHECHWLVHRACSPFEAPASRSKWDQFAYDSIALT